MSHLASAESDADFTNLQIERFREATADLGDTLVRHLANSAGTLRYPAASFDAVRCGIALYGISPFGSDPALDGLEPALRWESYVALGEAARARRQHRLRATVRRGRADLDRSRAGGLRGRLPA